MEQKREPNDYPYPVYGTQGGGLVRWAGAQYIFVESPGCCGLQAGDSMPEDWGIMPANDLANKEMMDQQFGMDVD